MRYELSICPHCLGQTDDDRGHEHGGIYYGSAYVDVDVDLPMEDRIRLADAKLEAEGFHHARMARAAQEQAELEAMEAEWRATAPAEQIRAYDAARADSNVSVMAAGGILREVWADEAVRLQLAGPSPLLGTPEDVKTHERRVQDARRRAAQETIDRFEAEGPVAVSFYALRNARRVLDA